MKGQFIKTWVIIEDDKYVKIMNKSFKILI